jgi:hypothetical protein
MFIFYKDNGEIVQTCGYVDQLMIDCLAAEGLSYIESESEPGAADLVVNGVLITPILEINIEALKQSARNRIEAVRLQKTYGPIHYNGSLLDGDRAAQDNIKSKLLELEHTIRLEEDCPVDTLVWRDADNAMHHFETIDEFRDWLARLAIKLTQRGTLAYQWAWAQKTLVDQEDDPEIIKLIPNA